jgi:ATP-dependent Lhr-like helicase
VSALEAFHPLVRRWFRERYGEPTDVQARAWPVISAGRHVLAVAPTGSGKTLCAFLWSIDRLASGRWEGGTTRVLYVSPLKALNNDIQRNLLRPLGELRRVFTDHGEPLPELSVLTRSGDTPEHERRRMVRRPPEILITTPESLNLLVSSPRARDTFRGLRTVILDEVHAVASSKRGTHLMTAVERLVPLAGEFQRIALSATVDPPERVGAFVGGFRLERRQGAAYYLARPVELVRSAGEKRLEIQVRFPAAGAPPAAGQGHLAGAPRGWEEPFWDPFIRECLERIRANRSTLIFTNTRRHAEKVARLINELAGEPLAYAHHGSLSREIRSVVERKLKRGELSAIVATSSLELGIDIGELDEVLLLQTPFSVASALQRIGRAGHAVGEVSRGRLYATHGR